MNLLDSLLDTGCHCGGQCGPCGGSRVKKYLPNGLGYSYDDYPDSSDWLEWEWWDLFAPDDGVIRIDTWEPYPIEDGGGGGGWWNFDWSWLFGPVGGPVVPDPLIGIPDQCGRLPGDPAYGSQCEVAPLPCAAWVEKTDGQGNTWIECTEVATLPDPQSPNCPPGYERNGSYCVSIASKGQRPTPRPPAPASGAGSGSGSAARPSRTQQPQLTPQQVCAASGKVYDPTINRCRDAIQQQSGINQKLAGMPIWVWALIAIGAVLLLAGSSSGSRSGRR